MSLPFLAPKKLVSVMLSKRKEDGSMEPEGEADRPPEALIACCEDILRAIAAKDAVMLAKAEMAKEELLDTDDSEEMPMEYPE